MRIGIIGGGNVAQKLGAGLARVGHDVALGVRDTSPEALAKPRENAETLAGWAARTGGRVLPLRDAAAYGDVLVNATTAEGSIEALRAAGAADHADRVLIDVSNPLDFSRGMPPALLPAYSGGTSLGEAVQTAFPGLRVVKAFNTINVGPMVEPGLIPGAHDLFLAGNDTDAKAMVAGLARDMGWSHIVDLGDIVGARGSEALLLLWIRLMMTTGSPLHGFHVASA